MEQNLNTQAPDSSWKSLYRVGGLAALSAAVVFRRNLGVEIALFSTQKQPDSVGGWFTLLRNNRLLGLAYLNVFDLVNYALVGLMFLALAAVLWRERKSLAVIAEALGFLGIAVYFASNTAFSMLALSNPYAAATTEAQKMPLLAAGQALLALNRFSSGAQPGSGGFLSLLLIAAAGMIFSAAMLRSRAFGKAAAFAGFLANGLDLAYCATFLCAPAITGKHLAVVFIPAAGFFFLFWHFLTGWRLWQLGRLRAESSSGVRGQLRAASRPG